MSGTLAPSTPTSRRLAGITSITINGSTFNVTELSWSPGIVERETMRSLSGVDGYKELPMPAYIAGKLRDAQSISVAAFLSQSNATVVCQLANGKTVTGHNLWYVGQPDVEQNEATFAFRFEGLPGTVSELGVS